MKTKKGLLFDVAFSVVWLIFLSLVLLVTLILINFLVTTQIDIRAIETDVLAYRFIYSFNGLAYANQDIQRVYPNYIDTERFTESHILEFFNLPDKEKLAAKLVLTDFESEEEKIIYYNQEWFDRLYPLALTKLPGPGGATMSEKSLPVIITDSDLSTRSQGQLHIIVVVPN